MKRFVFASMFVLSTTLSVAGAAFAVSKMCPGDCRGTAGNDRIVGSARAQTIYGERGNDRVLGRAGDDYVKGGADNDEVYGQEGNDKVKGTLGGDEIFGGPGDDTLRAGALEQPNDGARDVLDCGDGTDTAYFTPGQDVVHEDCEILNPPEGM